ncbi:GntR family transcriptional regulator [Paenirhodobacter hankyongi]|uniref:GntR family transcriptional regulator n=1 Tax=Paenirhodobacter hankyongi TaxID=2294033 RepID=UPI001C7DBC70|nr:GntR family transcriptional regulator [Sinirhodobacter hankyongi]
MSTARSAKTNTRAPMKRAADVVEKVYAQVREMAVEYRFRPGQRINEVELAQRFGVSRTPVRQSLSRLVHEEFVTFVPNRGFYAREIAPEDLRDICEFRALLECGAYRLSMQRASPGQIDALTAVRAKTTASENRDCLCEADEQFHVELAKMSGNPHAVTALLDVNAKLRFFRRIDLENPTRREATHDAHVAVLDCLRRRDPAGLEILRHHIVMSPDHAIEVTKEGLARIFFDSRH